MLPILLTTAVSLLAAPVAVPRDEAGMRATVTALTSPLLAGRRAGDPEAFRAASDIAGWFAQVGLRPAGTLRYEQPFHVPGSHGGPDLNIIGVIAGDMKKTDEAILVGAHYDGQGADHPGADDNASGVAVLIELARRFAPEYGKLPRPLCFVAFGAEEPGALGSKHFVEEPPMSADPVGSMLNLDMLGRLRDGALEVRGVGTSPDWPAVVLPALNETPTADRRRERIRAKVIDSANGPSDHQRFYTARKPVLYLTTGFHADRHTPRDKPSRLDYAGMVMIADVAERIIRNLLSAPAPPRFRRVPGDSDPYPESPGSFRGWTGMVLGKGGDEPVTVTHVWPDSPADRAGIRIGDRILQFGSHVLNEVSDYARAMRQYRPGEEVEVVFRRTAGRPTKTVKLIVSRHPNVG